jgi:hypothetical protein
MNLAEYRRELHDAYCEYREALLAAGDNLEKRTQVAQMKFFGDDDAEKAVMAEEDTRPRNRDRY